MKGGRSRREERKRREVGSVSSLNWRQTGGGEARLSRHWRLTGERERERARARRREGGRQRGRLELKGRRREGEKEKRRKEEEKEKQIRKSE